MTTKITILFTMSNTGGNKISHDFFRTTEFCKKLAKKKKLEGNSKKRVLKLFTPNSITSFV